MTTGTLPQVWRGRSGREYVPAEGARLRHGGMATVRKVFGRGGPVDTSTVADDVPLALKLWNDGDEASLDQLQVEAEVMAKLASHGGTLPCPRLYDLIGAPLAIGIVMEWCPSDLERWWREVVSLPDAFGRLMAALAEVCRRVADYHELAVKSGWPEAHGDLKPSNILISPAGRWLISDFGTARVARPENVSEWATSKVVAGTENFLAPETLFHAKSRFPRAVDTWAIGATTFALLRLQRMVLDGAPLPRNGTHSPRFRMTRIGQILEVYGREPTRFHKRELDPSVFPDNLRLPEEDRRAVHDSLAGVFGEDDEARETELAEDLFAVLDRALSIDPMLRYTDARALGVAFEELARRYIELAARGETISLTEAQMVDPGEGPRKLRALQDRIDTLEDELEVARADAAGAQRVATPTPPPTPEPPPPREITVKLPPYFAPTLGVLVALQLATLFASVVAVVVALASVSGP